MPGRTILHSSRMYLSAESNDNFSLFDSVLTDGRCIWLICVAFGWSSQLIVYALEQIFCNGSAERSCYIANVGTAAMFTGPPEISFRYPARL